MSARAERTCYSEMSQWPRWKTGLQSAGDATHRQRAVDLGRFWKSQLVELRPASGEDDWLSLSHEMEERWKSQNRKNVYISLYFEEPLNSKVIKSFVPELRSRYVFFEFRDSYVLCYIYVYFTSVCYVHFTHGRIWLWYSDNLTILSCRWVIRAKKILLSLLITNSFWLFANYFFQTKLLVPKCSN